MKLDISRHDGVLANCIEINHCPAVYPEPPWGPSEARRCQFCHGSGGAEHFLTDCPRLRDIRKKSFGTRAPSLDDVTSSPENIATFIRSVSAFCTESGIDSWQALTNTKYNNNNASLNDNKNNDNNSNNYYNNNDRYSNTNYDNDEEDLEG